MPIYQVVPTLATNDPWTAEQHNTYVKDNEQALYDSVINGATKRIAQQILGADAASITFASIPQNFTHLLLLMAVRGTNASTSVDINMRFNGDTGSNYDWQEIVATGGATTTTNGVNVAFIEAAMMPGSTAPSGQVAPAVITLPGYSSARLHKQTTTQGGYQTADTANGTQIFEFFGNWKSTTPINQILLYPSAGNFLAGSRFTLYGYR